MKTVQVEIFSDKKDLSEIGVVFRSPDGSPLNAQDLLDAFSDALLIDSNIHYEIEPMPEFDA